MFTVKGCGKGVNKDLLPSELAPGAWSDARNVEFSSDFARQRKGVQTVYNTPTAVPYFLLTYVTTAARFIVQAGTASVFVDDGSTRTDITGSAPTGGRDNRWTGGDFNGTLVLNNGVNAPMYWNGNTATNLAALTAWPASYTAYSVRVFKDYIVAGNIFNGTSTNSQLVMWSEAAEAGTIPDEWVAAPDNDAGDDPFSGVGAIVDFLPLGDVNIVYGREGRVAMQYVGGADVFRFSRLPGMDGLKERGCVVQTPKGHVFLTNGDVMIHSGGEAVSIAQGRIREWLFATMDSTNGNRSFLTLNPQRDEVWICFPSTGSTDCNLIAAWNWSADTWAIHAIAGLTYGTSGLVASALSGGTWASDSNSWNSDVSTWDQDEFNSNEARLVLATSTPLIGLGNTGSTDFGSTFTYYAERIGIRPSDENVMFFVRRSQWDFAGTAGTGVTVSHGMSKTADATPTYVSASFTQGATDWANAISTRGRYAAVKFAGSSGQQLSLRTFRLDLRGSGRE
jgi:hypothetical protein